MSAAGQNERSQTVCRKSRPLRAAARKWAWAAALVVAASIFLLPAQTAQLPLFADITKASKVQFVHQASPTSHKYLIEAMTGGVAVLDYDADGWLDIFLVNGAAIEDPMPA